MRKYYLPFIIIAAFLFGSLLNKCNQPEPVKPPKVYDSIPYFKAKIDSLKRSLSIKVPERQAARKKWQQARHDSIIPCEELLVYCDTLILKDDSLINDLLVKDTVNTRFNMYLVNRIKTDSIVLSDTCKYFGKEIKKQKWIKRLIIAAWIGREAVGGFR